MTDTNTTPTTPAVNPTRDFINTLIDQFSLHIEGLVERKVNAIFESHATLTLISDATEFRLKEMVKEMMEEHEGDYEHHSVDDIVDTVATHIAHHDFSDTIRRSVEEIMSDGDYATEERVQEMIDDVDHEEKVKEVLRNI